jgi:hypothetical protein
MTEGDGDEGPRLCLLIFPDWNCMVRLHRPHPDILNGTWTFPEAQRAGRTRRRNPTLGDW